MRRPLALAALLLALAACAGNNGTVAEKWLPRLMEENAFICQQSVCDTSERRAELTAELAADAREGGDRYRGVASLADRANLAYTHWEDECYPSGDRSPSAGMSCDEAFSLTLYGTDELEQLVREVATAEQ
ncbi:hypothetical protein I4I73_03340 [Pseudonocardia sp. KRD-184]|uniref:Uncharacterized protein n=1 Tax=Pseudonocardia oceani TaxID=2792013 RepID=A0ABS6UK36_9PSEU|nr:hypothetical protein [Pseudonocardia oceani]MBW0088249.1 hypothetical protein [Pseudonocardia oceani]MBW0095031.1 hypothetical protein [Pseudonocardia oceani]MBW0121116.1 hypothetical protein [Pseudonocardia oceani]MBW0131198.1 hypothetical protein [Pseudonocardia oceani]MBW0132635.1 hypothetical protein [Pseudonocardia oceani]